MWYKDRNLVMSDRPPLMQSTRKAAVDTDKDVRINTDWFDPAIDKTDIPRKAVDMRQKRNDITTMS